ncbi:MAG: metal ABC transporter permease [Alistipes sp.]|nr:metal ABC transporter permease [Alistipes sp.]
MIGVIGEILSYDFLVDALIACVLSGITCGVVGSYIVARRMVFLGGGITHASFGGLGMALYAGVDPLVGALSFATLSSVGIEFASRRGRMREDSAIGIIWALGMAIGAMFMSLRPGYATDLTSYLFGNILLVDRQDILWLAILTAVIIIGAVSMLRRIMFVAFDEEYAKSQGIPVALLSYIMAVVVAITLVLSIKVMGIILLLSLMTIPTVIVNSLTKDYRRIALWSAVVATLGNIVGFVASYAWDMPTGSCIIFTLTGALICVKLLSLWRKRANS